MTNLKNLIQLYIMHIVPSNSFPQEKYRGIYIVILEPCCLKKEITPIQLSIISIKT